MMQLRTTTKMAIQSAIAITLAEIIRYLYPFDRGYWITLAAMALTTQTWGDNLRRSFERVSMTILGGLCGTFLYWVIPANQYLILSCLLVFLFLSIFFLPNYYLSAMFTLTCFAVFLFALLGSWTLHLLRDRIIDTAIGAAIALFVSRFFLQTKTDICDLFAGQFEKMQATLTLAFQPECSTANMISTQNLYTNFLIIKKRAKTISYELFFQRLTHNNFRALLTTSAFCTQYVVSLVDIFHWVKPHLTKEDYQQIEIALATTQHNLCQLRKRLKKEAFVPLMPVENLINTITSMIELDPQRFLCLDQETLGFYNLMYFFTRLNTRIGEMMVILT